MSETEDTGAATENNDIRRSIDGESSGRSSTVDNLDAHENIPQETEEQVEKKKKKKEAEEEEEGRKEEKREEKAVENGRKEHETGKKEPPQSASSTSPGSEETTAIDDKSATREESGRGVGAPAAGSTTDGCNQIAAVGEWNSLPVLVERLRAALELSAATGSRRDDEPPAVLEDSGIDSEEDLRIRSSMERVLGCNETELKKDQLKLIEDLLLLDIQTALSRLKETLDRIDVAALVKHGPASDSSGKLQLLRLVSSVLSRLQIPNGTSDTAGTIKNLTEIGTSAATPVSSSRRRRGTRHTIGVSAEELARARKWLEEEGSTVTFGEILPAGKSREEEEKAKPTTGTPTAVETRPEEVHDKCTKDAINQRQSLRDRSKDTRENLVHGGNLQVEILDAEEEEGNMYRIQRRPSADYRESEEDVESRNVIDEEERNRVAKLAAVLRQRAELSANGGKYGSNKFSAKKTKIKRANTIDIPSYLKLQAESLGRESTGCVSLRRPINVSDKTTFNAVNTIVPTFQPKTDNDRKFLALINKNNDAVIPNPVQPFKNAFGNMKATDMSSFTNQHWNSRFSNIKTTFDKPSGKKEWENKPTAKSQVAKRFPFAPQTQMYPANDRNPAVNARYNDPPTVKRDSGISTGFRHAPSSPFRRIEQSPVNVSSSKIPPSYQWSKSNAPPPTNTLREKARMLFDREKVDAEPHEKSGYPRPPWLEHEKTEGKSNGTIAENGRLDYRSFCKQFAPFVGKAVSAESKKFEDYNQRRASCEKNSGVVDGKISFKMIPDKRAPVRHCPPAERREAKEIQREKFGVQERKDAFESMRNEGDRRHGEAELPRGKFVEATLRGSSSVAVQTGINDDHPDEGRSFRVAPKIPKGVSSTRNDASAQTELEQLGVPMSEVESIKQWTPVHYEQRNSNRLADTIYSSDDTHRFALNHRENSHVVPSEPSLRDPLPSATQHSLKRPIIKDPEAVTFQGIQNYQGQAKNSAKDDTRRETRDDERQHDPRRQEYSTFVPISPSDRNRSNETSNSREQEAADWPIENSDFLDDRNIENQDISPDAGVVTRYACAIATVASSVDSPEPRSEDIALDSRTSSSPSPSQRSWSRSRPSTNEMTPEEEIRRHNILQQSLVRRLQNETTSLNERSYTPPSNVTAEYSYTDRSKTLNQPASWSQATYDQPANFDQPSSAKDSFKYLSPIAQKRYEPPCFASNNPATANRVGALREAYEQTPVGQTKPIQKERSPIPNGVNPIDSSDEYLVSCATKPSRSIVLSKSESWHQLALSSNSHPRAQRVDVPTVAASSRVPSHPKPPKPKSPSSHKLRTKQYEASSMADSVKKMENKIRRYFDSPTDGAEAKDSGKSRRSSLRPEKGLVGLSRSRTMPGIGNEKLRLLIAAPQIPLLNVNTADVDKVFDDLFEEATRTDVQQC